MSCVRTPPRGFLRPAPGAVGERRRQRGGERPELERAPRAPRRACPTLARPPDQRAIGGWSPWPRLPPRFPRPSPRSTASSCRSSSPPPRPAPIIEWYDFYLYGVLAAFFSTQFFPKGNDTAALLASLATFGAGFAVRPFGAAFFGRIGDLIGRKFTFLVTITIMGVSTALVGILPTYAQIGILAPIILVTLRLAQGLALGGEYGGAAIYVAEHSPTPSAARTRAGSRRRRRVGLLLALGVIG